ncbi:NAD(P)/FAD-dependent oxidoreductase [Desulfitobacterium sp. Sab5]|uniref:NAD(P)/FAD-dependent oxidoreductase n=1 Tax=Desulfitobacterium nosdiversum TaxID=3375356 RepID=UPI003CE7D021
MNSKQKALIIGAGPAGLTAAYKLLKDTDIHPIIIEKESFVGGISRTSIHNGNRIDIGGHRFFSKSSEIMDLWQNIMPLQGAPSKDDKQLNREIPLNDGGPDPEKEERVLLIRSRVSRILYLRKFFDYPISLKFQTLMNLGFLNTFKAGLGYIWSSCFKRQENSLEDFMINRFGISLYRMFFMDYTEKVWGKHPKEISADWGAQRIKGLSLSKAIISMLTKPFHKKVLRQKKLETSLIETFAYPKKGPGQLWETMSEEIKNMGGELILDSQVVKVCIENDKIKSVIVNSNGTEKKIDADYFISTMPICDLINAFDCQVPKNVLDTALNLPYRDFITVGLLLNKLKLKNTTNLKTISDIIPDCWLYIQEPDVKLGRIQIFNNWSPYMVRDPENTVWIGLEYFCNEGDELWNMSDQDFINFAIEELVKIQVIEETNILDSVRIKVSKAYPAYFGSYENFDDVKAYLNTIENLYCIGRNGQHRYNNMDHSMLTAIEAVKSISAGNKTKDKIWSVNTETEYHETNLNKKERN